MDKIYISGLLLLVSLTGVNAQGFFKKLKDDVKKEEQVLNQNAAKQANNNGQRWMKINAGSEIPSDAVVGGKDVDGAQLFVAHANQLGNWHPGKTRKDWNTTSIEYGGQELNIHDYEILVGNEGLSWVSVSQGNIPENAVQGGHENQNNLFICRCEFKGSTQVGKTWQGINACRIGYGNIGNVVPNYEVLVQGGTTNASSTMTAAPQIASSTAISNSNSDIKVYNNYDFVPGANILFEDNFQDDQDGEFPAKWDLEKGQAVLNKVDGELALFITQGNYAKLTPRVKTQSYLTDPFTVEADYYVQAQQRNGIRIFIECTDGEKSLWFSNDGSVSSSYFKNDFSGPFPDANAKLNGHWHHAAFIFKNGQMKCYVDQYRVLLMPNTQITPVSIKFGGIGDMTNPMIFKNVRIAAGGSMNMIGKKFTDAKIVTHGINFDYGKASIRPESMGTLNMIKEVMIDNPELKFEIGGHTDNDGDAAYNLKLSQDRADAVRSALVDLGIDGTRLTTKGYGLARPITDNNTPEGKANNRRVEFVRL